MDDQHILKMLWQRLEGAIDALAQVYGKRLYSLAANILTVPQDAEEAVNDTYLALWNAIPPARPQPLCPYVLRVGRNTALKHLRYRSAQIRSSQYDISLEELAECLPSNTLEETLDARALGQAIDRFLDTVSSQNRRLFIRRYWFGDSLEALAPELGLTPQTAAVRLHRLRSQLKDYLNKEGIFL